MKQNKLIELVDKVETFGDAWDAAEAIFSSDANKTEWTAKDFEFAFKPEGVTCSVVSVQKKLVSKEATYKHSLIGREFGKTMPEAFKNAARKYLIK